MKLFVLGLDGASYRLICRYVKEGKLPNFKKVMEEGIFKEMETTNPPHTAPGWTTAFTGVQQGKHGIYQFWDTQSSEYAGKYMGREHYLAEPVWDILNQFSYKTIMINIPMTYPPRKVDGFIITWPLSNTLRYAYPNSILYEIAQYGGHYASDIQNMFTGDLQYIKQALKVTKKRIKTIEYVLENQEWDLLVSVFTEIDRISHFYWNFMDENSPEYSAADEEYTKAIEKIYMETDRALGYLLGKLPKGTITMLLSDHGFTVGKLDFYAQTYLLQHSLLQLKAVDASLLQAANDDWFGMEKDGVKYTVNWEQTAAYLASPGSFGININLKGRQKYGIVGEEHYEEYRDKVIRLFEEVTYPDSSQKLFRQVLRREEVYFGKGVEKAPDIILVPQDYSIMVHHSLQENNLFGLPEQKGMHDTDAVLGLYGEGIKSLDKNKKVRLEDITPTILSLFGIKVPEYMDGETCILLPKEEEAKEYRQPVQTGGIPAAAQDIYLKEEKDEVAERLKSLGYL